MEFGIKKERPVRTILLSQIAEGCIFVFLLNVLAFAQARNAQLVSADFPDTVLTSQVFAPTINMKNTGSDAWYASMNDPYLCELRSVNPAFNKTWGCDLIILGQGVRINPGQIKTFHANIRAPAVPGTYLCSWCMYSYSDENFFGDTAKKTIVVVQGDTSRWDMQGHEQTDLIFDDFEYIGSFTTPAAVNEDYWSYSPLALRKMSDGSGRVFMRSRDRGVYEAEIPDMNDLLKVVGGNVSGLPSARLIRVLGSINGNCGLYWDDSTHILYSSYYEDYYADEPFNILYGTHLSTNDTDLSKTSVGAWKVPTSAQALWRGYQYGVTYLSKAFADMYTGGRQFAVGWGGYFSICGNGVSRGPCLGAIARPNPASSTLDLIPLLGYRDEVSEKAIRDGNYFSSDVDMYWWDIPMTIYKGYWCSMDEVWSGVFIDLPDKKGYIAFASIGTGRNGYDYGVVTRGGTESHWYFYSLDSLGKAAQGLKAPGSLQPYAIQKVTYPTAENVVYGSCFDADKRLLYVSVNGGMGDGRSMINVYRVKEGCATVSAVASNDVDFGINAYYNPFNRAVIISMWDNGIGPHVQASLRVYDTKGRFVTKIPIRNRKAIWDASCMPGGVYLVKAKIGNRISARRITLIK